MDSNGIIAALDAEIARLQQVRVLLTEGQTTTSTSAKSSPAAGKATRAKRTLSPEARKRIADAQKKRWAAAKKSKTAATVTPTSAAVAKKSSVAKKATAIKKASAAKKTASRKAAVKKGPKKGISKAARNGMAVAAAQPQSEQ